MKAGTKITLIIAVLLFVVGGVLVALAINVQGATWSSLLETINALPAKYSGPAEPGEAGPFSVSGEYTVPVEDIRSVEVDWSSGWVDVLVDNGADIRFTEAGKDITEETALRWYAVDGVLTIRYCRNGTVTNMNKSLTLTLPSALAGDMERLTLDTASADVTVSGAAIRAKKLELDGASGNFDVEVIRADTVKLSSASGNHTFTGSFDRLEAGSASGDMTVNSRGDAAFLSVGTASGAVRVQTRGRVAECMLDTSSGNVEFYGEAGKLDAETASGSVTVDCTGFICPDELEINTASGDVLLRVGPDASFTLDYDTGSGDLTSDLELGLAGKDQYTAGSGAASFEVETASGDLHIC